MMNSLGSCLRYFNSLSHKFGDAATDNKNAITRMQSLCQANIWHVYPSTKVFHINQPWKHHENYSRSFWYNAQLLARKSTHQSWKCGFITCSKTFLTWNRKKWTFLHKLLNQMFTNENKYDKLIVHIRVLLEPSRYNTLCLGCMGFFNTRKLKCQNTEHLTSWQVNQELTQQMLFPERLTEIHITIKQAPMCHMKTWDC